MTKPKLGRTRAPNGTSALPRVNVGLNLGAAQKLKGLQDHFNTKLGFELTASQLIEYLYLLHTNKTGNLTNVREGTRYEKSSHMMSCPSYKSGDEDDCLCKPS
jgi:hypothetical protein